MTRIDAHQHYWQPERGDYEWMPMDNATLARTYAPADLAPHLAQHGIGKTVLVQAAATIQETEYLLGIADATDNVAGVVGWVDFERPADLHHLKRLSRHPKFLGLRPMIQDIADVDWMLRDDVQWGFRAVCDFDLSFDALGFPGHLANFLTILQRFPDMRVVIDHCMKPRIRDHGQGPRTFQNWADGMARIAEQTNAFCKFSGLVTEAGDGWDIDDIRPYADNVLQCFGPDRIMWGSDWPVCQLQASYDTWYSTAMSLTAHLEATAITRIFGGSAAEFYRLDA